MDPSWQGIIRPLRPMAMTLALLIALAGSLVLMGVIVRRLERG
jgi:hypothetical protein